MHNQIIENIRKIDSVLCTTKWSTGRYFKCEVCLSVHTMDPIQLISTYGESDSENEEDIVSKDNSEKNFSFPTNSFYGVNRENEVNEDYQENVYNDNYSDDDLSIAESDISLYKPSDEESSSDEVNENYQENEVNEDYQENDICRFFSKTNEDQIVDVNEDYRENEVNEDYQDNDICRFVDQVGDSDFDNRCQSSMTHSSISIDLNEYVIKEQSEDVYNDNYSDDDLSIAESDISLYKPSDEESSSDEDNIQNTQKKTRIKSSQNGAYIPPPPPSKITV